jgi:hypothetical protein
MPTGETYVIPTKMDSSGVKQGVFDIKGQLMDLASQALPILGVGAAIKFAGDQMASAIKDHVAYAAEIRKLALVSGTTAEETSRLSQVTSDFGITTADILKASKKLNENGLTPTIRTLAKLSDEYLALTSTQERNAFLTKNFGKDYSKYVEMMSKGSKTIMEQNDAVADNLILTQEMVDQAREAEIALDAWADAWAGLKTEFAVGVLPMLTDFMNWNRDATRAMEIMKEQGMSTYHAVGSVGFQAALKLAVAEREAAEATMVHSGAMTDEKQQIMDVEAATKAMTEANQGYLSALADVTASDRSYAEQATELSATQQTLLAEKQKLISQGYWPESEAIQEIDKKLAENALAQQANAAIYEEQSHRRIVAALTEYAVKDGLTDEEVTFLQDLQKQYGLTTDSNIANLKREQDQLAAYRQQIDNLPSNKTVTITTQYITDGYYSGTGYTNHPGRASGGPVIAGQSYNVSEFFQPEVFTAPTSGRVDPVKSTLEIDYDRLGRAVAKATLLGLRPMLEQAGA